MGVIGYELITEITPFHHDNVAETYTLILAHSEKSEVQNLKYPSELQVSIEFRDLIDHLVTKQKNRFTYQQIILHPYFDNIRWDSLRHQTPPIIPSLTGDDDTSNFEDVEKKTLRTTFTKPHTSLSSGLGFSGQNLPFIGYSFVHDDQMYANAYADGEQPQIVKLKSTIKDLQKEVNGKMGDIQSLKNDLIVQQRKGAKQLNDNMDKIISDSKKELQLMKEKLKEKTIEIATCKTQIKTLKSSLKIEEEMREKNDANISDVLNSTYQKWEKAKKLSEQNYEKQISEKKTEISCLTQTLKVREKELAAKVTECNHLQETIDNYKELLKKAKDQNITDRSDAQKIQKETAEFYEKQIKELKEKLRGEKNDKRTLTDGLTQLRRDSVMHLHSAQDSRVVEIKATADKNQKELTERLNKEIELNKTLREEKKSVDHHLSDLQRRFDDLQGVASAITSRRSSNGQNEVFHSVCGSFESLSSALEEQLRNDLLLAREGEIAQRKRVECLEGVIARLEKAIDSLSSQSHKPAEQLLERQKEKIEDKLASAREQAIIDRQQSRANLVALYKAEKELDKLKAEHDLKEDQLKRLKSEKEDSEKQVKEYRMKARSREEKISELEGDIKNLKAELKKEHALWDTAERERLKEKSETVMHISKVHNLQEKLVEYERKWRASEQRNDGLVLENKRLLEEYREEQEELVRVSDAYDQCQAELTTTSQNYEMLKQACTIMETQLNELEAMYNTEVTKNKKSCEKIDGMWKNMRGHDSDIAKLHQQMNEEKSLKIAVEFKASELAKEIANLSDSLKETRTVLIERQKELVEKTTNLFQAQENIEVNKMEIASLQHLNEKFEEEVVQLKEENARILTDFFMSKEENNRIAHENKTLKSQINDMSKELEHLGGTLSEMKSYYLQRDLKSEATQSQYKKLTELLQERVNELTAKKKKTFTEMIFGSNSSVKKENIPPQSGRVEDTEKVKTLQADLRRERTRTNTLKEQLLKSKTDMRVDQHQKPTTTETISNAKDDKKKQESASKRSSAKNKSGEQKQEHRFEMNIASSAIEACAVCHQPCANTHFKCTVCKISVHRSNCRGNVVMTCNGSSSSESDDTDSIGTAHLEALMDGATNEHSNDYSGEVVYRNNKTNPPLQINCVFEILDNILLLGK